MWPSILVPIVIFFGLNFLLSSAVSGIAARGLQKK
jgi:hypothetical protein